MLPLHSVGLQFLLLESISEHKTNLGNTNQLLEEMVCLHNHQAQTRMLLAQVRAQKVLSSLPNANSIHWRQPK